MAKEIAWQEFIDVVSDHLGLNKDEVKEDTDLYNDIGIDSLGVMSLGMKLKNNFGITVPLSAVSTITTLGQMLEVMNKFANE